MIVEVPFSFADAVSAPENRGYEVLGGGLSVATGDTQHRCSKSLSVIGCKALVSRKRVGHAQQGEFRRQLPRHLLGNHCTKGAPFHHLPDERVSIEFFTR